MTLHFVGSRLAAGEVVTYLVLFQEAQATAIVGGGSLAVRAPLDGVAHGRHGRFGPWIDAGGDVFVAIRECFPDAGARPTVVYG